MAEIRNPGDWWGLNALSEKDPDAYSRVNKMNDELIEIKQKLRSIFKEEVMLGVLRRSAGRFEMDRKYRIDKRQAILKALEPDLIERGEKLDHDIKLEAEVALGHKFRDYLTYSENGSREWVSFYKWCQEARRESYARASYSHSELYNLSSSL